MSERLGERPILHDRNRELSKRPAKLRKRPAMNSDPSKRRQLQMRFKLWTYPWRM